MFFIFIDNLFAKYTDDGKFIGDSSLTLMIRRALEQYGPGNGDKFLYLQSYFQKKYPNAVIIAEKNKTSIGSADIEY